MLDAEFVFYFIHNLLELAWCLVQQDGKNWKFGRRILYVAK